MKSWPHRVSAGPNKIGMPPSVPFFNLEIPPRGKLG